VYTLLWAGLIVNALVHLRLEVLEVQDGQDRIDAGETVSNSVSSWDRGGRWDVVLRVLFSPIITAYYVPKFLLKHLLFPRGIKSKFARQQEAEAKAQAAADRAAEAAELVRSWAPGEILFAKLEPAMVLGWSQAADAFDVASELIARTAGQPWVSPPTAKKKPVKAKVASRWNEDEDDEEAEWRGSL
jgi:hypothetical protein